MGGAVATALDGAGQPLLLRSACCFHLVGRGVSLLLDPPPLTLNLGHGLKGGGSAIILDLVEPEEKALTNPAFLVL